MFLIQIKMLNYQIGLGGIWSYTIYRYIFISDTVWSNTVNIEFDTSASKKNIYREEDTDWTAAEKVHKTLCSKRVKLSMKGFKNS